MHLFSGWRKTICILNFVWWTADFSSDSNGRWENSEKIKYKSHIYNRPRFRFHALLVVFSCSRLSLCCSLHFCIICHQSEQKKCPSYVIRNIQNEIRYGVRYYLEASDLIKWPEIVLEAPLMRRQWCRLRIQLLKWRITSSRAISCLVSNFVASMTSNFVAVCTRGIKYRQFKSGT